MGREKIGADEESKTSARKKLGRRVVGKARDSVDDDSDNQNSASDSKSLLGDVLNAFIDMVGDAASGGQSDSPASNEGNRKGSGRKPGISNEGRVASVASSVADQLRRRKN